MQVNDRTSSHARLLPMTRTYQHLQSLPTFEERFQYLKLDGKVGKETFGFDRYFNQKFYRSTEWEQIRNYVIARDQGCDLAIFDRQIIGRVYVHHMNPICLDDIKDVTDYLLNPEYLVCVSKETHDAIHYGDGSLLISTKLTERSPGDTKLW